MENKLNQEISNPLESSTAKNENLKDIEPCKKAQKMKNETDSESSDVDE